MTNVKNDAPRGSLVLIDKLTETASGHKEWSTLVVLEPLGRDHCLKLSIEQRETSYLGGSPPRISRKGYVIETSQLVAWIEANGKDA